MQENKNAVILHEEFEPTLFAGWLLLVVKPSRSFLFQPSFCCWSSERRWADSPGEGKNLRSVNRFFSSYFNWVSFLALKTKANHPRKLWQQDGNISPQAALHRQDPLCSIQRTSPSYVLL